MRVGQGSLGVAAQVPSSQNQGFKPKDPNSEAPKPKSEHKLGIFVRFWPSEPPFSGVSSTKSGFLCAFASKFLPDAAAVARSMALSAGSPAERQLFLTDFRFAPWIAAAQTDANLSAHLHRLPTPPAYLRRMRLQPGRGRCQMANDVAAPRGMHRGKPHRGKTHCGNALLGTYHPRTQPRGRAARERTAGNATRGTHHPGTRCAENIIRRL